MVNYQQGMVESNNNYFVIAALIAAKLDQANKVAKQLLITASNARAVALRAGESAAGFKPLTDFIDQLAKVTIGSSKSINAIASSLNKVSSEKVRVDTALKYFAKAVSISAEYQYVDSLSPAFAKIQANEKLLNKNYKVEINALNEALEALNNELRTAVILATLSRVEASQANIQFQDSLNNVANNVESLADQIKTEIQSARTLATELYQNEDL